MNKIMLLAGWVVLYGCAGNTSGSDEGKIENVIVITTDGLRWQEIYKGMDSLIAANGRFNQGRGDSARISFCLFSGTALHKKGSSTATVPTTIR